MLKTNSTKIDYLPIVEFFVDKLGSTIEDFFPLIQELEKNREEKTPEYKLFNRIWVDWLDYLEGE